VDQSDGATISGLSSAQTEPAIDGAMDTWHAEKCFKKVDIVKRADSGADPNQEVGFSFWIRKARKTPILQIDWEETVQKLL
jgi:hypothetical protein